jgi:heme-degrading monooxygenase HmoA
MDVNGLFVFKNMEDLLEFLLWVTSSFDSPEDFEEWLNSTENKNDNRQQTIDSEFWSIIKNGFHEKGTDVSGTN